MIASIARLWDLGDALAHALDPGDITGLVPRTVAASPGIEVDGGPVKAAAVAWELARPLRETGYRPVPVDRLVWSCTLQRDGDGPPLPDPQWADIADRIVAAAGLDAAPDSGPGLGGGCPWAAIRTRNPQRLVVLATLMHTDGSRPDLRHTAPRVRAALQLLGPRPAHPLPPRALAAPIGPGPQRIR